MHEQLVIILINRVQQCICILHLQLHQLVFLEESHCFWVFRHPYINNHQGGFHPLDHGQLVFIYDIEFVRLVLVFLYPEPV